MARINLLIITKDKAYCENFGEWFAREHSAEIQFSTLSDVGKLEDFLNFNHVDVVLAADNMELSPDSFHKNVALAYITDTPYTDTVHGQKAFCRYQKAEKIFRLILELYADISNAVISSFQAEGQAKQVAFFASSGGAGSTTISVAFAKNLARSGKKVVYFGFDLLPSYELYLKGDVIGSLSDIGFALKTYAGNPSNAGNLSVKLKSFLARDSDGVFFFGNCKNAIDIMDFDVNDIEVLINEVNKLDSFDYFVFDVNFLQQQFFKYCAEHSPILINVCEGDRRSLLKTKGFLQIMKNYEDREDISFCSRIALIINKNKGGATELENNSEYRVLGKIEKFGGLSDSELADYIAENCSEIFVNF